LAGIITLALVFGTRTTIDGTNLYGYSDANYASTDIKTWRSYSGYVFFLNRGVVTSLSKRQTIVALSSTKAELYSIYKAA
jgi:hypothetical protein